MKFSFSLKNKEVALEADVERLVEKNLDYKATKPDKKTKYQIKQEEKRKTEAAKHKQQMQWFFITIGVFGFLVIIGIIAFVLGI